MGRRDHRPCTDGNSIRVCRASLSYDQGAKRTREARARMMPQHPALSLSSVRTADLGLVTWFRVSRVLFYYGCDAESFRILGKSWLPSWQAYSKGGFNARVMMSSPFQGCV